MIPVLLVAAALLTGCVSKVAEPTAVPEPQKIHCDLIFPPPPVDKS